MDKTSACVESYRRLKNLKLVGDELGIPWQTVYVHLRKVGEPVNGDKSRYGSDTDRLAAKAEAEFKRLVPWAEDQNERTFQARVDFIVDGFGVDVKSSTKRAGRWAFSLKKQELTADFFVCFAYEQDDTYACLLVPGDVCRKYQSMSLSATTRTKWWDYQIQPDQLAAFFRDMAAQRAA
jgi:hypothetical protein